MPNKDPTDPVRADYRLIKDFIDKYGPDAVHIGAEYDEIIRVFKRAGGSWRRLFSGSVPHITLLKKVVKTAYKTGHITRSGFKSDEPRKGRG